MRRAERTSSVPNTEHYPRRAHIVIFVYVRCAPFMQMCLMRWLGVDVWIERIETWENLGLRWFDDMVSPSPLPQINPESVLAPPPSSSSHALTPLAFRDNLCRFWRKVGKIRAILSHKDRNEWMSHDARTQLLEKHKQTNKQAMIDTFSFVRRNHLEYLEITVKVKENEWTRLS